MPVVVVVVVVAKQLQLQLQLAHKTGCFQSVITILEANIKIVPEHPALLAKQMQFCLLRNRFKKCCYYLVAKQLRQRSR